MRARFLGLILFLLSIPLCVQAEEKPLKVYLIGNSLTWDTIPEKLDGDVQWHVDCGTPLSRIHDKPDKPCVTSSTLWPKALREKQYDIIVVQPFTGSSFEQDVEIISGWMKLQPQAKFVIHTGWAPHAQVVSAFRMSTSSDQMVHSPHYFRALLAELRRLHPDRELKLTLAMQLLTLIAEDITAGRAPLDKLEDLYRDFIHMKPESGKYLMHNAVRHAIGQPPSQASFGVLDSKVKKYLDEVLALLRNRTDRALVQQILNLSSKTERTTQVARLAESPWKARLAEVLSASDLARERWQKFQPLADEIKEIGGKVVYASSAPAWLHVAAAEEGLAHFDIPVTIDLYNGNNPLKGKGGRNERITDDWLQKLSGLNTLRRLDLANCAVQGHGLQHIAGLGGLRDLNLTLTPVKDDALVHLGKLTDLRSLGLASTQCTGTGFEHLKGLRHLENVNFHFTPLDDAGLKAISQVPLTGRLWFAHTKFTDEGAKHLQHLKHLKRCGIGSANKASSGEAVAALIQLPIEDLSLLDNQATPTGVAHAAQIATLKRLDLSHAPTVDNDSLRLLAKMPNLEELRIGSAAITDEGLQALSGAKNLKRVFLSGVKKVTPAGLELLKRARPELMVEAKP